MCDVSADKDSFIIIGKLIRGARQMIMETVRNYSAFMEFRAIR